MVVSLRSFMEVIIRPATVCNTIKYGAHISRAVEFIESIALVISYFFIQAGDFISAFIVFEAFILGTCRSNYTKGNSHE